ncbi:hypothetical protein B0J14DRAFT_465141, partial [Halenospora varia]
ATVFPIVFAAVFSRVAMKAAAWKLEKGSSLGTLEQLMGSRTVLSTLTTQFRLCAFNIVGVSLTLLWALSPLGGQSALRLIGTTLNITDTESPTIYFDTDAPSQFSSWIALSPGSMNAVLDNFIPLDTMYSSSLLTPNDMKRNTMDLWNNVKIPYLSSFEKEKSKYWTLVPEGDTAVYSSLVGIPVYHIPNGNSSFLLESSYLELHCSNITTNTSLEPFNSTLLDKLLACGLGPEASNPCPKIQNGIFQGTFDPCGFGQVKTTWALGLDTFIDESYWRTNKEVGVLYDLFPRHNLDQTSDRSLIQTDTRETQATLLFQSYNVLSQMYTNPQINYTQAYCKVQRSYVESRVDCILDKTSTNCKVTAQRDSQLPHASTNITHLSFPDIFRYMSSALPKANGATGNNGRSDLALYYIQNASNSVVNTNTYAYLDDVPEKEFSQRLGQLLNSYLMLSQAYTLVTGLRVPEISRYNQSTIAQVQKLQEVYKVSFLWLGIFLLATFVLLIAAITSVIFSHLTVNPEILGYCSLLVRDSQLVDLPPGGGTLDGIDMTKALKKMEVKIGEVGRISEGVGVLGVGLNESVRRTVAGKKYL